MAQINSGKMFTGYFNLTVQDIADLSLNDKIYLRGKYWNINKVIDYNANKRGLTKVELLSADDELALPKFPIRKPVSPPWGGGYDSDSVSSLAMSINDSLNLKPATVAVYGKKNFVTQNVKNAVVVGNNNFVTQDGVYTPYLNVGGRELTPAWGVFKAWLEFDEMIGMVVRQQVNTIGALTINQFTPAFGALELEFDMSLSSYTSNVGIHIASVSQDPRIFGIANDGKFFIDGILLGDIKQTSVTIEIYETAQIITE